MSSEIGRTALTLAGQVAGYALAGPFGAAIGSYLGATVGYALFPLDPLEGPRLRDARITASSYGTPIPRVRGRYAVGGIIIDASEIREVRHEAEIGGKGGPSQTAVTYTYHADIDVLLCEGPILGVSRVWANGKLLYDLISAQAPANKSEELAQSAALVASGQRAERITVYTGTDNQIPDPTFEALRGSGNVPAYLGYAHIVFQDLELEGGVLPNFVFEVIGSGTVGLSTPLLFAEQIGFDPANTEAVSEIDEDSIVITRTEAVVATQQTQITAYRMHAGEASEGQMLAQWLSGNAAFTVNHQAVPIVTRSRGIVAGAWAVTSLPSSQQGIDIYTTDGTPVATRANGNALTWPADWAYAISGSQARLAEDGLVFIGSTVGWNVADTGAPGDWHRKRIRVWAGGGGEGYVIDLPTDHYTCSIDILGGVIYVLAARRDSATACTLRLIAMDLTGSISSTVDIASYGHSASGAYPRFEDDDPVEAAHLEVDADGTAWVLVHSLRQQSGGDLNGTQVWRIAGGLAFKVADGTSFRYIGIARLRFRAIGSGVLVATLPDASSPGPWGARFVAFNVVTPAAIPLADVIENLCVDAGIPTASVDASAITATMRGISYGGGSPARSTLDQLMAAYHFSMADIGAVLVARPRGQAAVRSIDASSLVADPGGGAPVRLSRRDEGELPKRVHVQFANVDQDYDVGTQGANRAVTSSLATQDIRLSVVLTDAEAAQIADIALNAAWAAAETAEFSTGIGEIDLVPGDVIEIATDSRQLRLMLSECSMRADHLQWSAFTEHAAAFTSYATAQPATRVPQAVELIVQAGAEAMDVPLLRDADDTFGFYVAVAPYASSANWPGAELWRSIGGDYARLTSVTRSAVIGRADTVLGAWPVDEWRWDTGNTVDVVLRTGALSAGSDGAPRYALLGDEIIAFVNATQIGTGTYRLSRLLRGIQGTQYAQGAHKLNERFVLLDETQVLSVDDDDATLGLAQKIKAVSFGRTLASTPESGFTNTGARIKPMPPMHLAGSRQANGDTVIQWRRAARKWNKWRNYAAVPLDETPGRSYEIDIVRPETGQVLRTLAVSNAESVTYSAANAAADFGTNEVCFVAKAYQLNARIGRGMPATRVIHSVPTQPIVPTFYFDAGDDPTRVIAREPGQIVGTLNTGFDRTNSLFGTQSLKGGALGAAVFNDSRITVGTGDWYIGAWIYVPPSGLQANWMAISRGLTTYEVDLGVSNFSTVKISVWPSQTGADRAPLTEGGAQTACISGAWNHIAASRSGTTVRLFINGQLTASGTYGAQNSVQTQTFLGYHFSGGGNDMRLQELVLIRGAAYRTANFTPTRGRYFYR